MKKNSKQVQNTADSFSIESEDDYRKRLQNMTPAELEKEFDRQALKNGVHVVSGEDPGCL